MKVVLNEKIVLYIKWMYCSIEVPHYKKGNRIVSLHMKTTCIVTQQLKGSDKRNFVSCDSVVCNFKDIFSKDKGRKKSMEKAIQMYTKVSKRKIWKEYFGLKN